MVIDLLVVDVIVDVVVVDRVDVVMAHLPEVELV